MPAPRLHIMLQQLRPAAGRLPASNASVVRLPPAVLQASGSLVSVRGTSAGVPGLRLLLAALLMASVALGAGPAISPALAPSRPPAEQTPPQAAHRRVPPPPASRPHVDRFGDPLPEEAVARMGSGRMRHVGRCEQLLYSPDGKLLASCGGQWLMLWDPATGKLKRRFPIRGDWAAACAFCTDGIRVAATTMPKRTVMVQTFDPITGQIRQAMRMPDLANVADMSLSPDGRRLAYVAGKAIRLYDAATGRFLLRIPSKGVFTRSVDFAPDGHAIAAADFSDTVRLYDANTGKSIAGLKHAGDQFKAATWSPDGRFVATATLENDKTLPMAGIWDLATGREIQRFLGTGGFKHAVAFSPDGRYAAMESGPRSRRAVTLWDLATGKEVRTFTNYGSSIVFSPDGKTVATCSGSGAICLFDVASGKTQPGSADPYLDWVTDLHFSPDSTRLYGAAAGPIAWDVSTGQEIPGLYHPPVTAWMRRAISPDVSLVAEADWDGRLRLRDAHTGKQLHRLAGPDSGVLVFCFSPDSRRLYAAPLGKPVCEWDAATGKLRRTLPTPVSGVMELAVSPDGHRLAASPVGNARPADRHVIVWDLITGKQQAELAWGQVQPAYCLAWSNDSRLLAVAGPGMAGAAQVHVWDITSGTLWRTLVGQVAARGLAFSPDGRMLATGDRQGHLTLWELTSGRVRHQFIGHEDSISSVAFSPDGRLLASASTDAPVFLWAVRDESARSLTLSPEAVQHAWNALAGDDAAAAWDAVKALAAAPAQSVPFLQRRLRPARKADERQLKRLIAELDSSRFAARQRATTELAQWLEQAEPLLRKALTAHLSAEAQRRIRQLLQELDPPTGERLRQLRAVEVLESMATPEARRLLAELTRGLPEAGVTRAAKAALRRLVRPASPASVPANG